MRKLNRVMPKLPAQSMTTYSIKAPMSTHWKKATCVEFGCISYHKGWKVRLDTLTPDLKETMWKSGRKFTVAAVSELENWAVFEAGQPCFAESTHKVRVGRPELFIVRGGDWRGNPRGEERVHTGIANWIDDMETNRDKLMTRLKQG